MQLAPLNAVRMAATAVAIELVRPRYRVALGVVLALAVVAALLRWWVVVVLLALVAFGLVVAYRVLLGLLTRVGIPRDARRTVLALREDLVREFEALDLPLGPLSASRFAWRLARGRRPHEELRTELGAAFERIPALLGRHLRAAGVVVESADDPQVEPPAGPAVTS